MHHPKEIQFLGSNIISDVAWNSIAASDNDPHQSLVGVLFSCAWIESVINELLLALASDKTGDSRIAALAKAADLYDQKAPLRRKLSVLGAAATGREIDFGRVPLQDFGLLMDLRNWIVHLRPETVKVKPNPSETGTSLINEEYHTLINRLAERGVIPKPDPNFLYSVVTTAAAAPNVAAWSYRTAYELLEEVSKWLPSWRSRILLGHKHPPERGAARRS